MLTFFENMFRNIFFFLDRIIYGFIPALYNFIEILAKQQLLSQPTIQKFANNVYALLAIFMLFRLAFVLLNAIIDPDKLTSKDKGFGKIMTRFITGIFLIIIIPWAFDYAFRLQDMILEKDIMTRVVFGADAQKSATAGDTLARTTLSGFYYCNDNSKDMTPVQATDGEGNPIVDVNGNPVYVYKCDLAAAYDQAFPSSTTVGGGSWTQLSNNLNLMDSNGDYKYHYSAGISTACGIVILLMLITFSFDVALRVVKLAFLQLMTPIAVVGYIEPGGKRFNTWLQMCISTFLNLFIRLLALSIASFIITLVDPNKFTPVDLSGAPLQSFMMSSFVRIFIIIGSLLFVKEGPKMLSDILGIKEAGIGSINPLSKLKSVPFIGGAAAAGVGIGAGLAMKGAGGGVGALVGGLNSKFRGGSFGAGAMRGSSAAMKNIPLKGKLGAQAKGLFGTYRKASDAGATSAKGTETKTGFGNWAGKKIENATEHAEYNAREQVIANKENDVLNYYKNAGVGADEAGLFKNDAFKETYKSFRDQKGAVKSTRNEVSKLTNEMAQRQAEYAAARNNYQAHIGEYKETENNALSEMSKINPATDLAAYSAAKEKYDVARGRVSFLENNITDSQKAFTEAQNSVLGKEKELKAAETALSVKETAFEEQRKMAANKNDADVYATYKRLNDTGMLDSYKKK
jgi:hypothetical protein